MRRASVRKPDVDDVDDDVDVICSHVALTPRRSPSVTAVEDSGLATHVNFQSQTSFQTGYVSETPTIKTVALSLAPASLAAKDRR